MNVKLTENGKQIMCRTLLPDDSSNDFLIASGKAIIEHNQDFYSYSNFVDDEVIYEQMPVVPYKTKQVSPDNQI